MPGMDWTEKADAQLRKLWAQGLSTRLIGEEMGITKNAVVGRAHRLGLNGRPTPIVKIDPGAAERNAAQRAQALALHRGGMPRAQIAERLGVSANHASNLLRGVGQPKGRRMALPPGLALPTMHAKPAPMQDRPPIAPPVQVQPPAVRCCKWPLWGDRERPTHRYCEARTTTRRDGVPDVYCAAHRQRATAKTMWPNTAPRFAA